MNLSHQVDHLYDLVNTTPNISEGNLQLLMNLGATQFRNIRIAAQSVFPDLVRNKSNNQFRYNLKDNNNSIQVTLETPDNPDFEITLDWES